MANTNARLQYRRRRFAVVLLACLAVFGGVVFEHFNAARQPIPAPEDRPAILRSSIDQSEPSALAVQALGELAIKERAPRTGYTRAQFGAGWATTDGCDTRNRILQRDLVEVVLGDDNCTVLSGTLQADPYTGKTIGFKRGPETSGTIHIEHIVALSDSWQKGAQDLTREKRIEFANDPLNLIAVDGPANMQKGDKDAAAWLPHKPYRCRYIARQIAIKIKYIIWVTQSEYDAMKRVLYTCPGQALPLVKSAQASP